MGYISINTQGINGGKILNKKPFGWATVSFGDPLDHVCVDAFEGYGNDYKQREVIEISFYKNGEKIWSGSKEELFDKLKK